MLKTMVKIMVKCLCQEEVELVEYLLEEPDYGSEIIVRGREVSQTLVEIETYASFQTHYMLASIEE